MLFRSVCDWLQVVQRADWLLPGVKGPAPPSSWWGSPLPSQTASMLCTRDVFLNKTVKMLRCWRCLEDGKRGVALIMNNKYLMLIMF